MRRTLATLIVAAIATVGLPAQEPAQEPTLDVVLGRAAAYVTDYQKRLQGIPVHVVHFCTSDVRICQERLACDRSIVVYALSTGDPR